MKKTIIALFALAGVAAADSITLPTGYTWVKGQDIAVKPAGAYSPTHSPTGTSINDQVIENLASYIISNDGLSLTGWYAGLEGADANNNDITVNNGSFVFSSRSAKGGEYVALGINKEMQASSITLTYTADYDVVCSIWSYNAASKEATKLAMQDKGKTGSLSYNEEIETSQLFVVWGSRPSEGAKDGHTPITVSNISLSYSAVPSVSVPEPTTATLSLLALAGLAARRRRR